jgi:NAD(P)-dependent dehydrogenase (short-subunit alcohol dehydrogenase family)
MTRPASNGRRALVTGVARGIGRAITTRLLQQGWAVIGTYNTSAPEAKQLAAEHEALTLRQVDLSTNAGVAALVGAAKSRPLHALINNAGSIEFEERDGFDPAAWDRVFSINVKAPVNLALSLRPELRGIGAVVNIASTDAFSGSFNSFSYAASKAALLNATKSLANVLGADEVRVNAVTPGWVDTAMVGPAPDEPVRLTPLARLGLPEEIAACVTWLLSEEASFVNGASLVVDGGFSNVDYVLMREAQIDVDE